MSLKVITAPATEPITVDEAKVQLRVDGTDEDALIESLIVTARRRAEHLTGRALMAQTLELALDCFPGVIKLPRPPLVSVTSVKYIDTAGVEQTLAPEDYQLDAHSEPARLLAPYGGAWPLVRWTANSVKVRYEAGYANADAVPDEIKSWMLLLIGTLYANREGVATGVSVATIPNVDRLLDEQRVYL